MRMQKFKAFVKDHKFVIVETAVVAVGAIVAYTFVCGQLGYKMNKPVHADDKNFYVRTPTRRTYQSSRYPFS